MRASSLWILRTYRRFCQLIYREAAFSYDLVSWLISAGQWDKWRSWALEYTKDDQRVLELGFGTGGCQVKARTKNIELHGLEFSPEMVNITQKRCQNSGVHARLLRGDGCQLPYAKESFSCIFATFPEQYITTEDSLKECYRCLVEGGELILVGRYLTLDLPLLREHFPVFYRPLDHDEISNFKARAQDVGFQFSLVPKKMGWALHHIVMLKKVTA